MSAAFTPGPWKASGGRIAYVAIEATVGGVSRVVGHVPHMGWMPRDLANANARLIAAAPLLLSELEWAIEFMESVDPTSFTLRDARAAVAQARGEQVPA